MAKYFKYKFYICRDYPSIQSHVAFLFDFGGVKPSPVHATASSKTTLMLTFSLVTFNFRMIKLKLT